MNPLTLFDSKVEEDLQGLIDEVLKLLDSMWVSLSEKAKLVPYELKDVAHVLYEY